LIYKANPKWSASALFIVWRKRKHHCRAFGDAQQFSCKLTETDAREFDDNPIYAGLNFIHAHQYDGFGNHTRHDAPTVARRSETPQKISETWSFNEFGQPLSHRDPNGNLTTYAYFEGRRNGGDINTKGRFGGYLKAVTRGAEGSADPAPHLTRKFKVNALGMNTRERDEKGFNYDTKYNDLQEVVREWQPSVTLTNGRRVRYETRHIFDGAGNVVMTRRSNIDVDGTLPTNPWIDRSASYDIVNNLLSERVEIDGNDANDLITRNAYDDNDDQIIVLKPRGNRSFTIHDERCLVFKTFYGVAPAPSGSSDSSAGGTPMAGYPGDKRALTLVDTAFVGLSIDVYDARINRVRTRDGRGNFEDYFYDFYNREAAYSDPNGNGWMREFDDASNVLTESSGAVSKTTGQITELLARTYRRFDEIGRQYQQVRDIDLDTDESQRVDPDDGKNSSVRTVFDPGSRVILSRDANGNPTSMDYDAADRRLTVCDALGNVIAAEYGRNSYLICMAETEVPGPGASGEPETHVTTFVYDEINRQIEKHVLGLDGESIDHRALLAYDSRSNERLKVDAEDNVTLLTFDDQDRKVMMQRFDDDPFSGPATELTHYEYDYDPNSNKVEERALSDVTNAKSVQRTLYRYDNLGRQIRIVFPDSDDQAASGDGATDGRLDRVEIVFDESSSPVIVIDQRGIVAQSIYDPGDRLVEQTLTLPAAVPGQKRREFAYDALDRTSVARNDFAEVKTEYAPLSRTIAETQSIRLDGSGFATGWTHPIRVTNPYDKQSNRTSHMVIDDGDTDLAVDASYDALNRAARISARYFNTPNHTIAGFGYFGAWREQRRTLGNGAKLTKVFDVKRRLRSHAWTGPSGILVGFEYDYDRMDNPSFERFTYDMGLYDHFRYNSRYEVTGVSYRRASATPPTNQDDIYYYDDVFNRRQASFSNPFGSGANTLDCHTINGANEYTQLIRNGIATNPSHDFAGGKRNYPACQSGGRFR
jgi:YD repeat-containing protein